LWKAFAYTIIRTTIARLKVMRRTQIATTANGHSEMRKWRDNNVLGLITAWDHEIRFAPNPSSALYCMATAQSAQRRQPSTASCE